MAATNFIRDAGFALEDSVSELVTLLKAFHELADAIDTSSAGWPSWLFAMEARVDVIDKRAQAYIQVVHRHARSALDDRALLAFPSE